LKSIIENKEDIDQFIQSVLGLEVKIRKIRVDADVAPGSLNSIMEQYISEFGEPPEMLLVNTKDLSRAKEVVREINNHLLMVVEVSLFQDWTWAIAGKKGVFWSPGA